MKPIEKLPDLLEFFNIIARIRRLNEVFRLSGRIRYLYEVLCFILIIFDAFFLFITVIFNLKSGSLEGIATFDAVVVLFLWVEYLFRVNEQDNKWSYVAYQWTDVLAIIPFDYLALVSFGPELLKESRRGGGRHEAGKEDSRDHADDRDNPAKPGVRHNVPIADGRYSDDHVPQRIVNIGHVGIHARFDGKEEKRADDDDQQVNG